ncbi:DUF4347 domain-containing protein [Microcoleus sp. D2_18a_D3]|uniref:DUF4347 domain-containing protein n=1 Tax=Microcoleus sp. D2_18a_D3 TaxID=3055330 RepID=UPI002FCF630F
MLNTSKTINPATRIVVIDAGVENADLLIEGVISTTEVFVLDGTADGIEQISLVLQHRPNTDAVHIISHGSPGCLYLGNSQLSLDTLNGYATQLQQWDVAHLVFYGCNVAAGDAGEEFIARLHKLTGAQIAATGLGDPLLLNSGVVTTNGISFSNNSAIGGYGGNFCDFFAR